MSRLVACRISCGTDTVKLVGFFQGALKKRLEMLSHLSVTLCFGCILSWPRLALAVATLSFATMASGYVRRARTDDRIKNLGGRAPLYGGSLPFGMQCLTPF